LKVNTIANDESENRLGDASSPYLKQHAANPVAWFEWGDVALDTAQRTNKPIFLSIGYAACHWCHVMAHESFSDPEVAALMNRYFINIKVDREERPDIDEIYMTAVQLLTGHGGWPLSVFLTPDLKPFFGGTYFPPDERHYTPSFRRVVLAVAEAWQNRRQEIKTSSDEILVHLQSSLAPRPSMTNLDERLLKQAEANLQSTFDPRYGGFGQTPKFPMAMSLSFLLQRSLADTDSTTQQVAETSLYRMAMGGIYDHLGGGFHRYSTDQQWLVPHFEKMLYDQALLARVYSQAFLMTGASFYKEVAVEILDYVQTRLSSPHGCFYCSEDADSDGQEGLTYVWDWQEIEHHLQQDADRFRQFYGMLPQGSWEGKNILHRPLAATPTGETPSLPEPWRPQWLQPLKQRMLSVRNQKTQPRRDEKILTDWNGLMISALTWGYKITLDERFTNRAIQAANYLLDNQRQLGFLPHEYHDHHAAVPAFLTDHAFLAAALLDLYETTFDSKWAEQAIHLVQQAETFFVTNAGHYRMSNDPRLPVQASNMYDNAIPSGNSVMSRVLVRLATMTGEQKWRERASVILQSFAAGLQENPSAFPEMLSALDHYLHGMVQIIITGPPLSREEQGQLYSSRFMPNRVLLWQDHEAVTARLFPPVQDKKGETQYRTVYVCRNSYCSPPVSTLREALSA
jgi:uncharacterized protein YyaL (SSP411 family)